MRTCKECDCNYLCNITHTDDCPACIEYYKADAITELEKIKGEIGNEFVDLQDGSEEWRSYVNDTVLSCYEIIEKHISNLKGDN